jgi:hypothetical protein
MTLHENGLYDIYGIRHVPFWQTVFFQRVMYAVIFFCIVALCWCVVRVWLRKRRMKHMLPWERALYDLGVLQKVGIIEQDNGKRFYSNLSAILKKYMSSRYNVDFSGKTDKEMVSLLREYMFSPVMLQQLVTIFENGQIVKFAGGQIPRETIEQDFEAAHLLVKSTIPHEKK